MRQTSTAFGIVGTGDTKQNGQRNRVMLLIAFSSSPLRLRQSICQYWWHFEQSIFQDSVDSLHGHLSLGLSTSDASKVTGSTMWDESDSDSDFEDFFLAGIWLLDWLDPGVLKVAGQFADSLLCLSLSVFLAAINFADEEDIQNQLKKKSNKPIQRSLSWKILTCGSDSLWDFGLGGK